jgi:hypothetical protein
VDDDAQTLTFSLDPQFSFSKTNNTIYCKVICKHIEDVEGTDTTVETQAGEYNGYITLQFGT